MGEALMRHRVRRRLPKFTYTGSYTVIDDGHGDWRIRFLSSGTLTFLTNVPKGIDVFLVGGGGGGAYHGVGGMWARSGGGSGRTKTVSGIAVTKGTGYSITIGTGGKYNDSSGSSDAGRQEFTNGANGGASSAFGQSAAGGSYGRSTYVHNESYGMPNVVGAYGGSGGSGGGCTAYNDGSWPGGTNGGSGTAIYHGSADSSATAGTGQGTTTCEFGESGGTLYAQGGGSSTGNIANSGNGGRHNLNGSTGIVVIRNHRG